MILTYDGNSFVAKVSFHERERAKEAGFKFVDGQWESPDPQVAARLRAFADEHAEEKMRSLFIQYAPWSGRIRLPPGERFMGKQRRAVEFALSRNHSYLALDPGLGKTFVMIVILNTLGPHPSVIVAKPTLCAHWRASLERWCVWPARERAKIMVIPDSLIVDPLGARLEMYEALEELTGLGGATLGIEEAHRFKTWESQRTQALLGDRGLSRFFDRVVCLSGSPTPNRRPMELFPVLNRLAPETTGFRGYHAYGFRYCAGYRDNFNQLKFDGASRVDELMTKVRDKFMLRIRSKRKAVAEIVVLADKLPAKVMKLEEKLLRESSPQDLMKKRIGDDTPLSTYRRLVGLAKVPLVISFVKELLEESGESILLFAEHVEVVERLRKGLKRFHPIVITGATKMKDRQPLADKFQADKIHRLAILNMKVGGEGFTLTKATRVGLVEPSWVPDDNEQAIRRSLRIGQKYKVLAQYFVFQNSLDRSLMESNLRKNKITQLI